MPTSYTYVIANLPSLTEAHPDMESLKSAILSSAITKAIHLPLTRIDGPNLILAFEEQLSAADGALLDGGDGTSANDPPSASTILGDHTGVPTWVPDEVSIASYGSGLTNPDGMPYAIPKASGLGYVLHNRDVLVCCSKVAQADAIQDLKVATGTYNPMDPYSDGSIGDGSQVDWGEAIIRRCMKRVTPSDPNGGYIDCTDQADADNNASLTIVDFIKGGQGSPETFEVRGGSVFPDVKQEGVTPADCLDHRIYAVMAPGTGSDARFFDAYLEPYRISKTWVPATSTDALHAEAGPVDINNLIRCWFFYEPGWAGCHILQFTLYDKVF